jgi:hypothetical protein
MSSLYRPQGPTAFGSGPSYVEAQGNWIVDSIATIDREGPKSISPTREAEQEWKRKVLELNDQTSFPKVDDWYMRAKFWGRRWSRLIVLTACRLMRSVWIWVALVLGEKEQLIEGKTILECLVGD